jgi:hypothetical protein
MIRVRFPEGTGNYTLRHNVQTGYGGRPDSNQCAPGVISLGVKQPGREADHVAPSSAEVKKCVKLYLHSPNKSPWRDA